MWRSGPRLPRRGPGRTEHHHAGVRLSDPMVSDAQRLVARAHAHGVDARLELFPVDAHVFQLFWSFLPAAADAIKQVGDFAEDIRATASQSQRQDV